MTSILVWVLIVVGLNVPPHISHYSDKESCEAVRVALVELGKDSRTHKCVSIQVPSNRIT